MDNRTDVTEDLQSTPQHPPLQTKSGLTAGPHNNPPASSGFEDTYRVPANTPRARGGSVWRSVQLAVDRYPMQLALSVAGLGLAVILLARRRSRAS